MDINIKRFTLAFAILVFFTCHRHSFIDKITQDDIELFSNSSLQSRLVVDSLKGRYTIRINNDLKQINLREGELYKVAEDLRTDSIRTISISKFKRFNALDLEGVIDVTGQKDIVFYTNYSTYLYSKKSSILEVLKLLDNAKAEKINDNWYLILNE